MNKIEETKMPQSVHNHFNYIRDDDSRIRFLELFFGIKLKWYQKLYLKIYFSVHPNKHKQFQKFISIYQNKKEMII